jgi:cytochrome P450
MWRPSDWRLLHDDPLAFFARLAARYGDVASLSVATQRVYLVSRAEYIGEVLVNQTGRFAGLQFTKPVFGDGVVVRQGASHRDRRLLVQSAFQRPRLAKYVPIIAGACRDLDRRWRDGLIVDMAREMKCLSMRIAGSALFSVDLAAQADSIVDCVEVVMRTVSPVWLPFLRHLRRRPRILQGIFGRGFRLAKARLDTVAESIVETGSMRPKGRSALEQDLLSSLLEVHRRGEITRDELRDEVLTMLLTAQETTAMALAWTWRLLAENARVLDEVAREADAVLADALPRLEHLEALVRTRAALSEAMRLYPPVHTVARRALDACTLGEYAVPAGTIVLLSQYLVHRSPRYYDAPERFDPSRWTDARSKAIPKFAYFPFDAGGRSCVGQPFAWMEGMLVLALLSRRWRLERVGDGPIPAFASITLQAKDGIRVRLLDRWGGAAGVA